MVNENEIASVVVIVCQQFYQVLTAFRKFIMAPLMPLFRKFSSYFEGVFLLVPSILRIKKIYFE